MEQENYFPANMEQTILANQELVHYILHRYFNLPLSVYDDCFQEGILAMMLAFPKYDISKKTKFGTFAYSYIFGYVLKYIKNQAPALKYPTRMLDTRSKVESLIEDGLNQEEICRALELTSFQYSEIVKIGEAVSLNSVAHAGSDGGAVNYEDVVRDFNDSIENYVNRDTIMGLLQVLMPRIKEEDRTIYLEYIEAVIEGAPFKHKLIAEKYNCPVIRVSTVIKKYNRILKSIAKKEDFI